jgi:DNA-binding MarR family transcriptional regulator
MGKKSKKNIEPTHEEAISHDIPFIPPEILEIEDLEAITLLKHDRKRLLMEILLNQEKTIMDLSNETGWNPGTVKRHLNDLTQAKLVIKSREMENEFHIKQKYYRTAARRFKFIHIWPPYPQGEQ